MSSFKQRNLDKLVVFAQLLAQGEHCQITKLTPLFRLVDTVQTGSEFMQYLLGKNYEYLVTGNSLATGELISLDNKLALYESILSAGHNFLNLDTSSKAVLENVYNTCSSVGGTKRLYVHTTRRALADPDLLLLEQFARNHLNFWLKGNWAYWFAQTYCCDYQGYRYKPDHRSAQRVNDIVNFFKE